LFAWRLLRNRLPTRDNLARRSILPNTDIACVANCGTSETTHHLFLGCAISDSVWHYVQIWLVSILLLPILLVITLFSFRIWRACQDLLTFFSRLYGLSVFEFYGRNKIIIFLKIRLLTINSY